MHRAANNAGRVFSNPEVRLKRRYFFIVSSGLFFEHSRWFVIERSMRPRVVVVASPSINKHLGVSQVLEPLLLQTTSIRTYVAAPAASKSRTSSNTPDIIVSLPGTNTPYADRNACMAGRGFS